MVALGRGASPVDAVPLAGTSRAVTALPESLVALGDLPGARYVLAVDASGERVRGEIGGPPDSDLGVLAWARRLADVSRERGRTMEDVVLTTGSAFHLVRCVPGVGEDLWVVLRIDREDGNLALARRALAALGGGRPGGSRTRALTPAPSPSGPRADGPLPGPLSGAFPAAAPSSVGPATGSLPVAMPSSGPAPTRPAPPTPVPTAPAPRRAPDPDLPRPAHRSGPDVPALAFLPPRPARPALVAPREVPLPPVAPVVPAPRATGAVRPSEVGDGPSTPDPEHVVPVVDGDLDASSGSTPPSSSPGPAPEPEPALETDGEPEEADPATPGMWDPRRRPLTVRQARTWRTEAPEAPEPVDPAPSVIPAPRTGSLFAPVVVVPPPPSPVDDDTTEVPAPVPYPIITAPPLEPAPEPAGPAPGAAPEAPAATEAGLPRRVPGAQLRSPAPAPEPVAVAVAATGLPGWSTETSVLRRLITGLRRLT